MIVTSDSLLWGCVISFLRFCHILRISHKTGEIESSNIFVSDNKMNTDHWCACFGGYGYEIMKYNNFTHFNKF